MRVAVTGFAGFLGSHLTERLLNDGNEVIGLDNYFTGSKHNVAHLIDNPNLEIIRHDVTKPYNIECDEIYNLACPASPVHYQRDPIKTINTCVMGAINALELGVKVLQASTSEVYGDPLEHPQHESYWGNVNPIGVRSCYDEGKRCAETLFMDYHRQRGVEIRIARIFNCYGPRMAENDGRVVSNFIVQALNNEPITIYGDGTQTRCFQYIDDLIEGLLTVMNSNIDTPVNIGNPNEYTILELAKSIIDMTMSKSDIIFKDLPEDDPQRRQPDIELIKALGWQPKTDLITGLRETIRYFNNNVYLTIENPFNHDTLQKGKVYGVFEEG